MPTDNQALILAVNADVRSLERQMAQIVRAVQAGSTQAERRLQGVGNSMRGIGAAGGGVERALSRVFDNSRLAVLSAGASRISVFGSALESLGPAGIAGAAGIAAVAVAFTQARSAAEFADNIQDTAARLHISTDALQEFRYALQAAGGESANADEAIASFSQTLGMAQGGMRRAVAAFRSIGFSQAEVNQFHTVEEAITAVTERLQGFTVQARDAFLSRSGLTGLAPLINQGAGAMAQLRDEAERVGAVIDARLISTGADANQQFEALSHVIDSQLKSAFMDLAPVITGLLTLIAQMARGINELIDTFRDVEQRSVRTLTVQRDRSANRIMQLQTQLSRNPNMGQVANDLRAEQSRYHDIQSELSAREAAAAASAPTQPTLRDLTPPAHSTSTSTPTDHSAQIAARSAQLVARATEEELAAQAALTDSTLQTAAIATERLRIQTEAKIDEINAQFAQHQITAAARDEAIAITRRAAGEQQALIDQQQAFADAQARNEAEQRITDLAIEQLEAQLQMTDSMQQRRIIELQILELRQRQQRRLENDEIGNALERGSMTPEEADARRAQTRTRQGLERSSVMQRTMGPLEAYRAEIDRAVANMDEAIQSIEVGALRDLTSGLADAIANSKDLGDVLGNVLRHIAAQLIELELQDRLVRPLMDALHIGSSSSTPGGGGRSADPGVINNLVSAGLRIFSGHAAGTDSSRGGAVLVGESGPEVVNLPAGSQVIPNSTLKGLAATHRAAITLNEFHLHAEGAVMTNELMAAFDGKIRRSQMQTIALSNAMARRGNQQRAQRILGS